MLPRGYYPEDVEEDVDLPARPKHARPLWRRALPVVVVVAALAGFSGLLLATYFSADSGGGGPTPLIQADARPYKTRPESPGGLDVPHQDMEIFNRVQPGLSPPARAVGSPAAPRVERLLPPPDAPLPRPVAAPPVLQPEIPSPPAVSPPADAVEVQSGQRRLTLPATPAPLQGQGPAPPPAPPAIVLRPPAPNRDQIAAAPPLVNPSTVAPTPNPPVVAMPANLPGFRIQLGVMRSADEAEREWQRLLQNHGDVIGRLSSTMVPSTRRRTTTYRIQAGPLLTSAGAAQLCRRLTSRGVGCFVVKP